MNKITKSKYKKYISRKRNIIFIIFTEKTPEKNYYYEYKNKLKYYGKKY